MTRGTHRTAKRSARRRRQGVAFTLIELLVVVAIIALLVSILMPTLAHAKELARRVACLSNLKNMAIGAHEYLAEYGGSYPIGQYRPAAGSEFSYIAWDFRYRPDGTSEPGLVWSTRDDKRMQQCPANDGDANFAVDPYTGYNYNVSYIGHGEGEDRFEPARDNEVAHPAETALFGDGQYSAGANKFMRSPFPWQGDGFGQRYAGTQGYRHAGCTNVAFCDGHAEPRAERYTEITPEYYKPQIAEGTGFLSPDNSLYDLE